MAIANTIIAIFIEDNKRINYVIPNYVFVLERIIHLLVLRLNTKYIILYNYMSVMEGISNIFTIYYIESNYFEHISEAFFIFTIR